MRQTKSRDMLLRMNDAMMDSHTSFPALLIPPPPGTSPTCVSLCVYVCVRACLCVCVIACACTCA